MNERPSKVNAKQNDTKNVSDSASQADQYFRVSIFFGIPFPFRYLQSLQGMLNICLRAGFGACLNEETLAT